jgi:hypothetical protein
LTNRTASELNQISFPRQSAAAAGTNRSHMRRQTAVAQCVVAPVGRRRGLQVPGITYVRMERRLTRSGGRRGRAERQRKCKATAIATLVAAACERIQNSQLTMARTPFDRLLVGHSPNIFLAGSRRSVGRGVARIISIRDKSISGIAESSHRGWSPLLARQLTVLVTDHPRARTCDRWQRLQQPHAAYPFAIPSIYAT